jgi:hypothetical protein
MPLLLKGNFCFIFFSKFITVNGQFAANTLNNDFS